ncbi:MAG: PilZ domain-containing protein [Nitrospirae bacterium]|nr:PilZ domain-containing protein [Nitrospirota bacterium]
MDARRHKRVIVDLQAELILGDTRLAGTIENLSDEGLYIVTGPMKSSFTFTSDTVLELRFRLPSGERQSLHCRIKWFYKTPPFYATNSIGMEIVDPPPTYIEALKELQ